MDFYDFKALATSLGIALAIILVAILIAPPAIWLVQAYFHLFAAH